MICTLTLLSMMAIGQDSYMIMGDSLVRKARILDAGTMENCRYCRYFEDNELKKYGAEEVSEYRILDGPVYFAKEVQIGGETRKVFMKQLTSEKANLYFYHGRDSQIFIIEKDSVFTQLDPGTGVERNPGFHSQLSQIMDDCPHVQFVIEKSKYDESSLNDLLLLYQECKPRYFPHTRYGISAGFAASKLISHRFLNVMAKSLNKYYSEGRTIGLFADIPLHSTWLSFYPELGFSQNEYQYSGSISDRVQYYRAESMALSLPLNLKYAVSTGKFRFSIHAGPQVTWQFRRSSGLYTTFPEGDNAYTTQVSQDELLAGFLMGGNAGLGIEYLFSQRSALQVELRIGYLLPPLSKQSFIQSPFMIKAGCLF